MPDAVREVAIAIATGTTANAVLESRFRTAQVIIDGKSVYRSAAEIMSDAATLLIAQANHSRNSVLSILKNPMRD